MWNNFESKSFAYQERNATVIYPSCTPNGRLMLKTEYLDAFPYFELAMLGRGYTLCCIEHQNGWGTNDELDIMADFVRDTAKELSLNPKCIIIGMSGGGLSATKFAERYPELSAVLFLDGPVLNVLSAAGLGEIPFNPILWRQLVCTFGFTKSTVINYRDSAIDHMEVLIKHDIPVIMLYGNADNDVVYEENGRVLENYYRQNGGRLKIIVRSACGHHPHSLPDPTPIIDFVEKNI